MAASAFKQPYTKTGEVVRHDITNENLSAALDYAKDGYPVIPLHWTDETGCSCRKPRCTSQGKHPLTAHGVTDATTDLNKVREWWRQWPQANIGLAMGTVSGRMVLDVDIKKGKQGDESLAELEGQFESLPLTRKHMTPSGWHLIFNMPKDGITSVINLRPGLDLLAHDRYIVAPPSTIYGKGYCRDNDAPFADCPAWLPPLTENNHRDKGAIGNQFADFARELFPQGKLKNGEWVTNCPYHHPDTNPSFSVRILDGFFHCFGCDAGGTSFAELYAMVKGISLKEAEGIVCPVPSFVQQLNDKHAVVMMAGKCLILNEESDPVRKGTMISYSRPIDLHLRYENQQERNGRKMVSIADLWLKHPDRRQYDGVIFDPSRLGSVNGYYNLWKGFAVDPKEGDCSLFLAHLLDNVCNGNEQLYQYLLVWMADAVQRPQQRPGVAVVFMGPQGVGKSIVAKEFGALWGVGVHYVPVSHGRHLVGNFNAHLQRAIVVFADEAFWAGDKAGEGVLKAMITEEVISIERKGHDVMSIPNHIHLMMASNHDWVVPAGLEERRFCVFNVSTARMQDHSYFGAIARQMENGGREALLKLLLDHNLDGLDLRRVPQTQALIENKMLTLSSAEKLWHEILQDGTLSFEPEWTGVVVKADLHNRYIDQASKMGVSRRASQTELGKALKKLCPSIGTVQTKTASGRVTKWVFPDLQTCRKAFDRALKWEGHVWPEVEGDAPRAVCQVAADGEDEEHAQAVQGHDTSTYSPPEANWSDYAEPVQPSHKPGTLGLAPQAIDI